MCIYRWHRPPFRNELFLIGRTRPRSVSVPNEPPWKGWSRRRKSDVGRSAGVASSQQWAVWCKSRAVSFFRDEIRDKFASRCPDLITPTVNYKNRTRAAGLGQSSAKVTLQATVENHVGSPSRPNVVVFFSWGRLPDRNTQHPKKCHLSRCAHARLVLLTWLF